jgi:hypothetical protein
MHLGKIDDGPSVGSFVEDEQEEVESMPVSSSGGRVQ